MKSCETCKYFKIDNTRFAAARLDPKNYFSIKCKRPFSPFFILRRATYETYAHGFNLRACTRHVPKVRETK